jgi:4-diphosphocytidyl-2-C-methyl-D-erythritol kinase
MRRATERVCVPAPAKLNLFLEIRGKRPDGYHELDSVMARLDLCDSLTFLPTDDPAIRLDCSWAAGWQARAEAAGLANWGELPPAEENLAVRAARLLQQEAGEPRGGEITLVKRIPAAAGLGGASSDAAAALVAANAAWGLDWPRERLMELAARLGSDVPFFVTSPVARAQGRGELLESCEELPPLWAVVVRPNEGLSTPLVYRHCRVPAEPRSADGLLAAWRGGRAEEVGKRLHNRLAEPARELSPWIGRLAEEFGRLDTLGHQMSGSGTSYFGLARDARHARRLAAVLRGRGWGWVVAARVGAG